MMKIESRLYISENGPSCFGQTKDPLETPITPRIIGAEILCPKLQLTRSGETCLQGDSYPTKPPCAIYDYRESVYPDLQKPSIDILPQNGAPFRYNSESRIIRRPKQPLQRLTIKSGLLLDALLEANGNLCIPEYLYTKIHKQRKTEEGYNIKMEI